MLNESELPDDCLLATAIQNLERLQNHHPKRGLPAWGPRIGISHGYLKGSQRKVSTLVQQTGQGSVAD